MSIASMNPWQVLDQLQNEALRYYGEPQRRWHPAVDIIETETGYQLNFDVPGVSPTDVSVEVEQGVLRVQGHRQRQETETQKLRYKERAFGQFNRTFKLPEEADSAAITARYEKGVLSIDIARKAVATPRKIAIDIRD
jgi:HSP20 family protein